MTLGLKGPAFVAIAKNAESRLFINKMSWYVYIIYSDSHQIYYKGETEDPVGRVRAHNDNLSDFTRNKGPWTPVYIEILENRSFALKREKQLKKLKHRSIINAINSNLNIVTRFF